MVIKFTHVVDAWLFRRSFEEAYGKLVPWGAIIFGGRNAGKTYYHNRLIAALKKYNLWVP